MPQHQLHRTIHRRIWKNTRGKVTGTPQGTLTHTLTHIHNRTPSQPRVFHHSGQGSTGTHKEIKEAMYIKVDDPSLNRNLGKIPTTIGLGPGTKGHTITAAQVIQSITSASHPLHPTLPKGGGITLF